MDLVERLRVAAAGAPSDRRGRPVRLTVLPACSAAVIAALQAQYDVPLPTELTSLLAATRFPSASASNPGRRKHGLAGAHAVASKRLVARYGPSPSL